ncbi:MAG: peptidase, partial [Pseudomonadota bacterium]
VLDRLITLQTPLSDALKAAFVSMDATLQSNLSVGTPLDLVVIPAAEHRISVNRRVFDTDADWQAISAGWSQALQHGFNALPEVVG